MHHWGIEDPVEGLAFEVVASDGTVLESSPVWLQEITVDPDPDYVGTIPISGDLVGVLSYRGDWPAIRLIEGSEVIFETADPTVQRVVECPDYPRVRFISPPPGHTVRQGESVEVSWTTGGLDGDNLRYRLFLYDESGSTELGQQLSESSYRFDVGAHDKIAFRVIASYDGGDAYGQSAVVRVEAR